MPEEVQKDDFGGGLKAYISFLYFGCRVTEPKIKKMPEDFGISISEGTISDIISKDKQDESTSFFIRRHKNKETIRTGNKKRTLKNRMGKHDVHSRHL